MSRSQVPGPRPCAPPIAVNRCAMQASVSCATALFAARTRVAPHLDAEGGPRGCANVTLERSARAGEPIEVHEILRLTAAEGEVHGVRAGDR